MSPFVKAIAVGLVIAAPVTSFAQSNQSLTHAEVRADLVRVEQTGYNPDDAAHYPQSMQAAEQRAAANGSTGYGPGLNGTGATQAGHRGDVVLSTYSAPVEQR